MGKKKMNEKRKKAFEREFNLSFGHHKKSLGIHFKWKRRQPTLIVFDENDVSSIPLHFYIYI